MLASLISKLMDKSSWPILSLLMYWDHWIWMNTFWRIFFFLDSGKLLQLFFWSFDLRNACIAPEGIVIAQWCVTALSWPGPLYLIVCYARANEDDEGGTPCTAHWSPLTGSLLTRASVQPQQARATHLLPASVTTLTLGDTASTHHPHCTHSANTQS